MRPPVHSATQQSVGPRERNGNSRPRKNGAVNQCLTIEAPSAGTFSCPGGQTLTLSQVSYSGIQIKDDTNDVTQAATPASLSATPFTCP